MKGRWRELYQQREWMTRVDISLLYQMDEEAKNLQRAAGAVNDSRLQQIADRFTYLTAQASGRTSQCDLTAEAMPEDLKAKIPDPRPGFKE